MQIEGLESDGKVMLADVAAGDVFAIGSSVYIVVSKGTGHPDSVVTGCNLKTGQLRSISDQREVAILNCKLVVSK